MTDQDKINDRQFSINEQLFAHVKIANHEMGDVKNNLTELNQDMRWVKAIIEKVETRTWVILSTIIVGFVVTIALNYFGI